MASPARLGGRIGDALAGIIARLHGGSLMVNSSEAGVPAAILALPTGPMPTRVTVRTPRLQRDGGLSVPLWPWPTCCPPGTSSPAQSLKKTIR